MARNYIPLPSAAVHISKFLLGDLRRTGVYFLYHRDELVYVGQTRTLKHRLEQHLADTAKEFDSVAFIQCTIDRLLAIEGHYICKYAPKYNRCGIAKSAREAMSWRKAPIPARADMKTIDASEVIFNSYEAAEFLNISQADLREWRQAGLLPQCSMLEALNLLPQVRQIVSPKRQLEAC